MDILVNRKAKCTIDGLYNGNASCILRGFLRKCGNFSLVPFLSQNGFLFLRCVNVSFIDRLFRIGYKSNS